MNRSVRQAVLPLLAALIWGVAFVFQKGNTTGTFLFNAGRSAVAVVFLFFFALIREKFRVKNVFTGKTKEETRAMYLGGVLTGTALCLASFCQQSGMDHGTDAGKAGFITALYVVFVPIFGLAFRKRASLITWISVVIAVAGLYLLSVPAGRFSVGPSDLTVLGAAFLFAFQILFIDRYSSRADTVKLSLMQFFFAGVLSFVLSLIFERLPVSELGDCLFSVLYLGVVSSGIGYTLQIASQKNTNPTVVSVLMSMEAVFSVIAGAVFLRERMTLREIAGCVIMFSAILLSILSETLFRKAKKSRTD